MIDEVRLLRNRMARGVLKRWADWLPGTALLFSKVISHFNYINRVADALGLDPEPAMQEAFERWRKSREQSK